MMDRIIFFGLSHIRRCRQHNTGTVALSRVRTIRRGDSHRYISTRRAAPVSAGLSIYDTMQLVSRDVATICDGHGRLHGRGVLLTAGAAGKRYAPPHSRVMIHQPLGGVEGQASDIEITARR